MKPSPIPSSKGLEGLGNNQRVEARKKKRGDCHSEAEPEKPVRNSCKWAVSFPGLLPGQTESCKGGRAIKTCPREHPKITGGETEGCDRLEKWAFTGCPAYSDWTDIWEMALQSVTTHRSFPQSEITKMEDIRPPSQGDAVATAMDAVVVLGNWGCCDTGDGFRKTLVYITWGLCPL